MELDRELKTESVSSIRKRTRIGQKAENGEYRDEQYTKK